MKNAHDVLGVINMSDLILKEIYGIYEIKNSMKEQIKKIKNDWRRNQLNKKSNKKVYVRNDVMTFVIKHCRVGKKKEAREKQMDLEKN